MSAEPYIRWSGYLEKARVTLKCIYAHRSCTHRRSTFRPVGRSLQQTCQSDWSCGSWSSVHCQMPPGLGSPATATDICIETSTTGKQLQTSTEDTFFVLHNKLSIHNYTLIFWHYCYVIIIIFNSVNIY